MAGYFAQVTLLAKSGDPADNQVNGFAFEETGAPTFGEMDTYTTAIKDFYDDVQTVNGANGLETSGHLVKFYDILGAAPNYPIYETTWSFAAATLAVDLPLEVALAVSYKNTVNNTVPRARRRGRIYISGWTESVNSTGRPSSIAYEGLADAYKTFADTVNTIGTMEAGVWSRRDGVVYPIQEIWCDNEWDTQRRRGTRPTVRYGVDVA
jgi:hypothetical protein